MVTALCCSVRKYVNSWMRIFSSRMICAPILFYNVIYLHLLNHKLSKASQPSRFEPSEQGRYVNLLERKVATIDILVNQWYSILQRVMASIFIEKRIY